MYRASVHFIWPFFLQFFFFASISYFVSNKNVFCWFRPGVSLLCRFIVMQISAEKQVLQKQLACNKQNCEQLAQDLENVERRMAQDQGAGDGQVRDNDTT